MPYEVRRGEGAAIVVLEGEVDLARSPEARKAILGALEADLDTAVDLSGVTYIDSSGIASLVEGLQSARRRGRRFALIGVSGPARSVLELARLDRVFEIHPDLEAWKAARGGSGEGG